MPLYGATFDENSVPRGQWGLQGRWAATDNLMWVVDPETHPGAPRPLSLCATPPTQGIFRSPIEIEAH